MANAITNNGSVVLTNGAVRSVLTVSSNITCNGNNYISQLDNLSTSSYSALNTSSLTDLRYMSFQNTDLSASIIIATDNAGTNKLTTLWAGDNSTLCWSGSLTPLYAKGQNNSGTTVGLQYILSES